MKNTRRQFLEVLGAVSAVAVRSGVADDAAPAFASAVEPSFRVRREELELNYRPPVGARRLSFAEHRADPQRWRESCRRKLGELCAISSPAPSEVKELWSCSAKGVTFRALVMPAAPGLSIAAYLLEPEGKRPRGAVMAIQGHGDVEGVMGVIDDYHHGFGFELARAGFLVLCPVLRGFGVLRDLAWASRGERCLDYWSWDRGPQFTLVTDGFVRGRTLIGETVEDLLRWEQWLGETRRIERLDVAGISYGGDVAVLYPVFSRRVRRIFASGTLGSFEPVFFHPGCSESMEKDRHLD